MKLETLSHTYLTRISPISHSLGKHLWSTFDVAIQEPKSRDAKAHAITQQILTGR